MAVYNYKLELTTHQLERIAAANGFADMYFMDAKRVGYRDGKDLYLLLSYDANKDVYIVGKAVVDYDKAGNSRIDFEPMPDFSSADRAAAYDAFHTLADSGKLTPDLSRTRESLLDPGASALNHPDRVVMAKVRDAMRANPDNRDTSVVIQYLDSLAGRNPSFAKSWAAYRSLSDAPGNLEKGIAELMKQQGGRYIDESRAVREGKYAAGGRAPQDEYDDVIEDVLNGWDIADTPQDGVTLPADALEQIEAALKAYDPSLDQTGVQDIIETYFEHSVSGGPGEETTVGDIEDEAFELGMDGFPDEDVQHRLAQKHGLSRGEIGNILAYESRASVKGILREASKPVQQDKLASWYKKSFKESY